MSTPSNSNTLPFWTLLGRAAEVTTLIRAFEEVRETSKPKVLTLLGDSGRGKTRLLAELYATLAKEYGHGYWPDTLDQHPTTMKLNPQIKDFNWAVHDQVIPEFYWWAIRFSEPNRRNDNTMRTQLYTASETLLHHLAFANHADLIHADKKAYVDLCIDCMIEIGTDLVPGAGLAKSLLIKTLEINKNRRAQKKIEMAMSDVSAAEKSHIKNLSDEILGGIDALIHRVIKKSDNTTKKIPFVLCLDDAHWSDKQTANFVSSLIERGRMNNWPILIVITAWPSEWGMVKNEINDSELRRFHHTIDAGDNSQLVNLQPLPQIDQLIEMALPDLPVTQRSLLSKKSGPDLYGLYMLIEDIKDHPKFFTKPNGNGSLKRNGINYIQTMGPLREEVARSRLRKLVKSQQTILSVLACFGHSFIRNLGLEVLENLKHDGYGELTEVKLSESFDEIVSLHQYIVEISSNVFAFSDQVKLKVTRDLIIDDPNDVNKVQLALLLVVNRWLELGTFGELSNKEIIVFFDNARSSLAENEQLKKHKSSLIDMVAARLQVINDIFFNSTLLPINSKDSNFSSAYILDIFSFRSGLPIWWQAKWLERKLETVRYAKFDLKIYEYLITATTRVLNEAVLSLKSSPDTGIADAACISAVTLVGLTWSCINQGGLATALGKSPAVNETQLLNSSLNALNRARSTLEAAEDLSRTVSITLLAEAAEIARGLNHAKRDELWQKMGSEIKELIRSSSWNEQVAQLLFDRAFNVCLSEWVYSSNNREVQPIVDAILEVSNVTELKQLGDYQLVILGMAYEAQSTLGISDTHLLDQSLDCCFELIRRGFGDHVLQRCWLGGQRVAASIREPNAKGNKLNDLRASTWVTTSSILTRLFEEEARISPSALFEMSKLTLIPYASLFFEPWTVSPGHLGEFISQIHSVSPNSMYLPLTSAAYAWYISARRQANNTNNLKDANWVIHELEAIKAISLVPRCMIEVTRDYDRLLKLTEPFFEKLKNSNEPLPVASWFGSCVVATLDCKDLYTDEDFVEVISSQLMNVILAEGSAANVTIDVKEEKIFNRAKHLIDCFVPSNISINQEALENLLGFRKLVTGN